MQLPSDAAASPILEAVEQLGGSNEGRRADFLFRYEDGSEYLCQWAYYGWDEDPEDPDPASEEWFVEYFDIHERNHETPAMHALHEDDTIGVCYKDMPCEIRFKGTPVYLAETGLAPKHVIESLKGDGLHWLNGPLAGLEERHSYLTTDEFVIEYPGGDAYQCHFAKLSFANNGKRIDDDDYRQWTVRTFAVDKVIVPGPNLDEATNTVEYSRKHVPSKIYINGELAFDASEAGAKGTGADGTDGDDNIKSSQR